MCEPARVKVESDDVIAIVDSLGVRAADAVGVIQCGVLAVRELEAVGSTCGVDIPSDDGAGIVDHVAECALVRARAGARVVQGRVLAVAQ